MKRLSLLVGLVGIAAFFLFVRLSMRKAVDVHSLIQKLSSEERAEDPIARARQEWMQLRDPSTNRIPESIRSKELAFARTLPDVESMARKHLMKSEVLTWTSRGPYNQGGRTRALAYDLSDATGNTILAGGVSGGVWKSTDGGGSWTRTSSLSDSVQSVSCIAQDPTNLSVWYYGTGELTGNSARGGGSDAFYHGDGIYKSTDDGQSWQKLTSTASWTPQVFDRTTDYVWDIVVDPTNGNVYAAIYGEIIRSTNGGTNWSGALSSTSSSIFSAYTDIAVTSGGTFYAVMSSEGEFPGIYRSTTGAAGSWTNITPAGWPTTFDRTVLAIAPSDENVVYFLGSTPGSGLNVDNDWTSFFKYTYVSGDGSGAGGTWDDRTSNLPTRAVGGKVSGFAHQGGYDLVVKVKPNNENVVFIGGTNLYRSTDGFASSGNTTWIGGYSTADDVSQYANHHPDQHSLAFKPASPGVLLSGCDGGISETTNDSAGTISWTRLNNGYMTSQFYSVAIDMATPGDQTVIGGMQDNGHMFTNTSNGATPWVVLPFGGDGGFTAIADGRSSYYICTQNGGAERIILDSNGGLLDYAGVKPSGGSNFLFTTPYVLDPNNTNMMYMAAGSDVWRNSDLTGIQTATNGGNQNATSTNWTDLTNASVAGRSVTALGISTVPSDRLYFGTDSSQVFRIDNAGTGNPTATDVSGTNFPAAGSVGGAYVSCIAVNPRNADTAIAVFSNYNILSLFLTGDGGTSWTSVGGNLEQIPDGTGNGPSCRWATILPKNGGVEVYVATSTGVYSTESLNGMSTVWALEGASVIGNEVTTMVISRPSDGMVVAATHGNGVFGAQAVTSVQSAPSAGPRTFALDQNYPNPFNPSTSIHYQVPAAGSVKLAVYDITGRRIATLVEGTKNAGSYTAVWDGKTSGGLQAASGVYFYRLEAGNQIAARKMVFLK